MLLGKTFGMAMETRFRFRFMSRLLGLTVHVMGHGENLHHLRIQKPVKNVGTFPPRLDQFTIFEQ